MAKPRKLSSEDPSRYDLLRSYYQEGALVAFNLAGALRDKQRAEERIREARKQLIAVQKNIDNFYTEPDFAEEESSKQLESNKQVCGKYIEGEAGPCVLAVGHGYACSPYKQCGQKVDWGVGICTKPVGHEDKGHDVV